MDKIKNTLQSIPKAFVLFGRALKNAKKDFWISIQVLFWVSLALSILFYIVEHAAQPNEYPNWWQAFVWTITRYIGDPGHFSGKGPITLTGRHIDSIIGILKILIFAVPAGLVANGFRKAMDDDRKKKHLQECHDKILKSFKRVSSKIDEITSFRVAPRNVSIASLVVKRNMTENDIIDTVGEYKEFKLRNTADTQTRSEHPQDRLVIELLPLQEKTVDGKDIIRRSYGIKINRDSNITIVAPTADLHNSIGHFAYYLAQFGGFNLVSRLFAEDVDDRVSFYTIEDEEKNVKEPSEEHNHDIKHLEEFICDIKDISSSKDKWNIIVSATKKAPKAQVHFAHKNQDKESVTTLDEEKLSKLLAELSEKLQTSHGIHTDVDNEVLPSVSKKNISIKAGGGSSNNAFLMRLSYKLITWTDHWTPIIVDMAKIIRDNLEKPVLQQQYEENSEEFKKIKSYWKKKGIGLGEGEFSKDNEKDNERKKMTINALPR